MNVNKSINATDLNDQNVAEATGGDEGNRTPVQNIINISFYKLSLSFNFPFVYHR